jgi:vacuolar iron transporter family protein
VAEALTAHDPVSAHADAELRLSPQDVVGRGVPAAVISGLGYGAGAAIPLIAAHVISVEHRVEVTFVVVLAALALSGWFASWLTGLPLLRMVRRNVLLGAATMAAGILIGTLIQY